MKTYGTIALHHHHGSSQFVIATTPDVTMRLKRILPGVNATRFGDMRLSATDEACADIEMILARWPMELDQQARQRIETGARATRELSADIVDILSGTLITHPDHLTPARPLREYQKVAHALATRTGSLLLADDLGLGKTTSAQAALADPALRPMLVVTLTGLERQWAGQLALNFPELTSHVITTGKPYELADESGRWPDMVVINYPKLAKWSTHLAGKMRSVVFDEVQELRRDDSQKHAAACHIASGADLKMGLSATPVFNFGGEMFSIMTVLRPGLLGSRDEFKREWCTISRGLEAKTRIIDPAAFRSYLLDHGAMLRRLRADVQIELPAATLIEQNVDADLSVIQNAESEATEIARLILDLGGDRKARWQAAGELDWKMRQATGVAKAPFVAEFVRLLLESQERIMLFGWHRSVYDIWTERLAEFNPVLYTGTESPAQKAAAIESFTGGDSRVLIMSLRSGAGLDGLQDYCQTAVFGELDWSPGVHKQAVGRLHRPGQEDPVFAYFCVSDSGADPVMLDALNVKSMEADLIIDPDSATIVEDTGAEHIKDLARSILDRAAPARRSA